MVSKMNSRIFKLSLVLVYREDRILLAIAACVVSLGGVSECGDVFGQVPMTKRHYPWRLGRDPRRRGRRLARMFRGARVGLPSIPRAMVCCSSQWSPRPKNS
ncbi:hypothetical protein OCU04_005935 [Sclerotinia nivalis]|uniref:Uncharacterized protein n=1 Tax=Sclerotinia nivalis TaxID=352851 RepID=A0A9X0AM66_9HELO|nr:hypothetical protein OCU04_005935 [Sclerotinia nivalis]